MFLGCSCKPHVPYHTTLPESVLQHGFEDENAAIAVFYWNLLAILRDENENDNDSENETTMTMTMTLKQENYTIKIL